MRHGIAGAGSQASTSVNERIDNAAEADAQAFVARTPEATARATAADRAIDRQEKAETNARLLRDAIWAFALAAIATAIAIECPALARPMAVIAYAGVMFALVAIALRAWLNVVPFVIGGACLVAIAYRIIHSRMQAPVAPEKKA